LQSFPIILCRVEGVNAGESFAVLVGSKRRCGSRYNLAMHLSIANRPVFLGWMLSLSIALGSLPACTFYKERPANTYDQATGGESLERVFWKHIGAGNWTDVERALASNYSAVWPSGILDRSAALDQYRKWSVKEYSLGDLTTEMNGNTIVVTYTVRLNGTAGSQQLPSGPCRMMTVWQQQKKGWIIIAQNVGVDDHGAQNQSQP
jgi:hypothetical protein